MNIFVFAVSLGLGPLEKFVIVFSGITFVVTFGIASAKGDQKGMIESMLAKPINQNKKK